MRQSGQIAEIPRFSRKFTFLWRVHNPIQKAAPELFFVQFQTTKSMSVMSRTRGLLFDVSNRFIFVKLKYNPTNSTIN